MINIGIDTAIHKLGEWIWGWPLVIFVIITGLSFTAAFYGIQYRYFIAMWRYLWQSEKSKVIAGESYITTFQAFVNTLSASLGNGSTAGMATAIYSGGPGAAFWVFVLGFLNMAIRFAEVYASTLFTEKTESGVVRGGPMVFLRYVPGRSFLPWLYAFFGLLTSFIAGSAMQCNSVRLSVERMTSAPALVIAICLVALIGYILMGGALRIIRISDKIIPLKVLLFFSMTLVVLIYHYDKLIPALALIWQSAFTPQAVHGALAGHTVQNAIRFGMSRLLSATEAGLGTAGVLFGATGTHHPVHNGVMSMASIVISNHLVCFTLLLIFVATGVWNSGLTSTAMTCAAYETVFGPLGCWIVTFLSIAFGIGVLVAYAYIGRECWLSLTKGRYIWLYNMIYTGMAFVGALSRVDVVWNAVDITNAGMMIINLYGLWVLLPQLATSLKLFERRVS
ncbi:MAG TPA: amino acid carrier protein [Candidatus Babeliaceae bacterium]|nr:amino acid carrier protein [Candidatus Babeliaceae bacterium]